MNQSHGDWMGPRGGVQCANLDKEAEAPGALMCLRHLPPTIPAHGPANSTYTEKRYTRRVKANFSLLHGADRTFP